MKNTGHGEKTVHFVTAIGFFIVAILIILCPQFFTSQVIFAALFFLLGLKTIGNIIIDGHNTIHYFSDKKKK